MKQVVLPSLGWYWPAGQGSQLGLSPKVPAGHTQAVSQEERVGSLSEQLQDASQESSQPVLQTALHELSQLSSQEYIPKESQLSSQLPMQAWLQFASQLSSQAATQTGLAHSSQPCEQGSPLMRRGRDTMGALLICRGIPSRSSCVSSDSQVNAARAEDKSPERCSSVYDA